MKLISSAAEAADKNRNFSGSFYLEVIPVSDIISFIMFAALLLFAAIKDIKTKTIPDVICVAMIIPAAIRYLFSNLSAVKAIGGLLIAAAPLLLMAWMKRGTMGGGDIKLSGAAGLVIGFYGAFFMLFASCLFLLCMFAVFKLLGKIKSGSPIPFAPFIAAGGILAYSLILLGG